MNEKVRITCHLARMQGGMLKFIKTKELRKEMLMKKGTSISFLISVSNKKHFLSYSVR